MANSEILAAIKSLQSSFESHLLITNQMVKEFMYSFDSRFTSLQHNKPPPGFPSPSSSSHPPPTELSPFTKPNCDASGGGAVIPSPFSIRPKSPMEAFALAKAYEARLDESRIEPRSGVREPIKAIPFISVQPSSPPNPFANHSLTSNHSNHQQLGPFTHGYTNQSMEFHRNGLISATATQGPSTLHPLPQKTDALFKPPAEPPPHRSEKAMAQWVAEMLTRGIIRPSRSPFSSPISWVHKKGGSYPSYIDIGREPPVIPQYVEGATKIQALKELLLERDTLLRQLKDTLRQTQHHMRQKADRHRRDLELQIGDLVLVRLQPYRQTSVRGRGPSKLAQRFYGPFKIVEKIGLVAYRLDLPPTTRIHPVFHISKLRPYKGASKTPICELPPDSRDSHPLPKPLAICGRRNILMPSGPRRQILVQWCGEPPECSTWEDSEEFGQTFADSNLEDKVGLEGEGNVTALDNGLSQQQLEGVAQETIINEPKKIDETGPAQGRPIRNKRLPTKLKDYVLAKSVDYNDKH